MSPLQDCRTACLLVGEAVAAWADGECVKQATPSQAQRGREGITVTTIGALLHYLGPSYNYVRCCYSHVRDHQTDWVPAASAVGPPRTHVTHTPATGVSRFHQASEAEGSGRLGLNTQFLLVYLFVFVVVVGFLFIYNGNVQDTEHVGFIKAPPIPMTMDIGYKVQNQCQDPGLHCPMTCCASF